MKKKQPVVVLIIALPILVSYMVMVCLFFYGVYDIVTGGELTFADVASLLFMLFLGVIGLPFMIMLILLFFHEAGYLEMGQPGLLWPPKNCENPSCGFTVYRKTFKKGTESKKATTNQQESSVLKIPESKEDLEENSEVDQVDNVIDK